MNLSSAAFRTGGPNVASDGAVDSFTIGPAPEVAQDGIRINAVQPEIPLAGTHLAGGPQVGSRDRRIHCLWGEEVVRVK